MFAFAKTPSHKLYKNVVHDHEYVHGLPIEIYAEMLHRNLSRQTDSVIHGNANALSNGFLGRNSRRIHRKRRDALQHGIYYVLPNGVSAGTIFHIPGK